MTKENLRKIAKEISTSRRKKGTHGKGKGKHKLILSKESEDEEEVLATTVDILDDAKRKSYQLRPNSSSFLNQEQSKVGLKR